MENIKGPTLGNSKICYIQLPAINIDDSAAFYQKVFGWKVRKRSGGNITFDDGIGEVSGTWVLGREPSTEQGLVVSIMVDNVEETIALLEAGGSKIVFKKDLGGGQFMAWFTDPAGNILGIYQHPGGGHGKICYVEIPARNVEKSASFYEAIFNWPLRNKGTEDVAFDDGVGVVSGMWVADRKPSIEPGLLIYVMMDSVADAVERVIANGGKIVQPVGMDAPEITARFSDPFGNVMGLYQNPV
jgi:predicted enzyme related to lactoylglutathione lyase